MDDHDGFAESLMAKSDQINAADLMGGPITIKIAGLKVKNSEVQKWTMRLEGNDKFFRPCLGMRRLIAQIWGEPQNYAGRSMTIYRDPDVKYSAKEVGGIRISHMSNMDGQQKISVPISRTAQKEYLVRPLTVAAPAPEPTPPAMVENALAMAQDAAKGGTSAFTAWWQSEVGRACRPTVKPKLHELQATAERADTAAAAADAATTDEAPM